MRSRLSSTGLWPAAAAALGLGQAPVGANTITIHAVLCGSIGGSTMLPIRVPLRPDSHDRSCPPGCHAACTDRRRDEVNADSGAVEEDVDDLDL